MKRMTILAALSLLIIGCCPLTSLVQEALGRFQNATPQEVFVLEDLDPVAPENLDLDETPSVEPAVEDLFVPQINPCEGIYEKYPHDPTLGEIKEDYVGSWHQDPSLSARWSERWVFFPSGNYLFIPSQYECAYSSNPNCTPTPIEDGLWGVMDNLMYLATSGDLSNILTVSITPVVPSTIDESPYPYKTTIERLPFWLYTKDTNYWDPETGEYCGW